MNKTKIIRYTVLALQYVIEKEKKNYFDASNSASAKYWLHVSVFAVDIFFCIVFLSAVTKLTLCNVNIS